MKKHFKPLFILLALFATLKATAQKENYIWHFGQKAGIDFNTNPPTALINSAMNTREGCSSVSDANGNLLFYTDGENVYTRNHTLMPNGTGLLGGQSSTQSVLIVKQPGNNSLYYLFTTDEQESATSTTVSGFATAGLNYSVVDLSQNGGLGDVVNGQKNISLLSNASEKVVATYHSNGTDVWIVTHDFGKTASTGDGFYAYLLGSTGINSVPVITNIGYKHTLNSSTLNKFNMIGYLRFSPDGSRLATAIRKDGVAELFNFDKSTGVVSNLTSLGTFSSVYGLEFSPNNSVLYVSTTSARKVNNLGTFQYYEDTVYQFNLAASTILASRTAIATGRGTVYGALALAPDGKIYLAQMQLSSATSASATASSALNLSVINNPNGLGAACMFTADGFNLSGMGSNLGLPNSLASNLCQVNVFAFPDSSICTGASATIVATGASTYSWFPSTGLNTTANDSVIASPAGTTTYTVIGTSGACADTATVTVTLPASPILITVDDFDNTTCNGNDGAIIVNTVGGYGAYNYSWAPVSGNTNAVFGLAPGSYSVYVTDAIGCKDSLTGIPISAYQPMVTNLLLTAPTACNTNDGQAVVSVLSGGFGSPTFSWNTIPATNNDTASNLSAGVYVVTLTDQFNCSVTDTAYLNSPTGPTLSFNSVNPDCNGGNNGVATVNMVGGTSPFTTIWNNAQSSATATGLTSGDYYVTVTGADGCTSTGSVSLTNPTAITSSVTINSNVLCKGSSTGFASGSASGGTGGLTLTWSNGNSGNFVNGLAAGNYQLYATDTKGCIDTTNFTITEPATGLSATLLDTNGTSCFGVADGFAEVSVSGGTVPYTYSWAPGNLNGSAQTTLAAGTYQVFITDSALCADTVTLTITQPLFITVAVSPNASTFCSGATTPLTITGNASGGTGNLNYSWNTGESTSSINVLPAATTVYTLLVSDANNCSSSANSTITVSAGTITNANASDTICPGTSMNLNATGGTTYVWTPSTGLNTTSGSAVVASPSATTTYYVTGTSAGGCVSTDSVTVYLDNTTDASFTYLPSAPGTTDSVAFTNTSVGTGLAYVWDFGDNNPQSNITNPLHLYQNEGEFNVVLYVTNSRGCKDSLVAKIKVEDLFSFDVPNVFTPNADGTNDIFSFINAKGITELHCEIFNRWGLRVYQFNGAKGSWDGYTQSGDKCADGTYYYVITLTTNKQEKKEYSGYLYLGR